MHINFRYAIFTENLKRLTMEKLAMVIRITPKTREKLEKIKQASGLAYGVIVDYAIDNIGMDEEVKPEILITNGQE